MKYSVSGRVSCAGGGRVCVVEQSDLRCPRLLTRTAAAPSRARGNQLCSDRMQEVSWMKYDFKAHSEMGKYHITGIEFTVCLHALKIHGFIMQRLWCISQNFNVYRCGLFVAACINITRPRRCSSFSFFSLWTRWAEWITVASFVCLGSFPGQQRNIEWIVSVCFVELCPIWKTGVTEFISLPPPPLSEQRRGFLNTPVAKWVVPLKRWWQRLVLQLSPRVFCRSWWVQSLRLRGGLHSQRIISTPSVMRRQAWRWHYSLLICFKSKSFSEYWAASEQKAIFIHLVASSVRSWTAIRLLHPIKNTSKFCAVRHLRLQKHSEIQL